MDDLTSDLHAHMPHSIAFALEDLVAATRPDSVLILELPACQHAPTIADESALHKLQGYA